MSGTVGNIIASVEADVSPLAESMKEAQNDLCRHCNGWNSCSALITPMRPI